MYKALSLFSDVFPLNFIAHILQRPPVLRCKAITLSATLHRRLLDRGRPRPCFGFWVAYVLHFVSIYLRRERFLVEFIQRWVHALRSVVILSQKTR